MKTYNYTNYRAILLDPRLKSVKQFFEPKVPIILMASILNITVGKCHYLLTHTEQIHPHYLILLDEFFEVDIDTFWDLCEYQWKRDFKKHRLSKVRSRY